MSEVTDNSRQRRSKLCRVANFICEYIENMEVHVSVVYLTLQYHSMLIQDGFRLTYKGNTTGTEANMSMPYIPYIKCKLNDKNI